MLPSSHSTTFSVQHKGSQPLTSKFQSGPYSRTTVFLPQCLSSCGSSGGGVVVGDSNGGCQSSNSQPDLATPFAIQYPRDLAKWYSLDSVPSVIDVELNGTISLRITSPLRPQRSQEEVPAVIEPVDEINNSEVVVPIPVPVESPPADSSLDMQRIQNTMEMLHTCGWYYEGLTYQEAARLLHATPVGTFLLRDSADSHYLFALSVQTERGPTSIRIHYVNRQFRLDSEDSILSVMPLFDCVVRLVEYYIKLSRSDKARAHVWLDNLGRRDLHIRLTQPLQRKVSSLQHLCRTRINGLVNNQGDLAKLNLPTALKKYLDEYPYQL